MKRNFKKLLEKKWDEGKFLCVGLDPDFDKIPKHLQKSYENSIFNFNKAVIEATADLVAAYKPQVAHYEARGVKGWGILKKTVEYLHKKYPDIPLILDAKRGDIGSTNSLYAKAIFDELGFDALTIQPYLGQEAVEPFLEYKDKGLIVLVRTSNLGAGEFQDLKSKGIPLYQIVAKNIAKKWNRNGNVGVVVGATYPKELKIVRQIIGDMPILIPGIGAQGGDLEASVKNGLNNKKTGIIIHSSRAIIYASSGKDFDIAARGAAVDFDNQIRNVV